MGKSCGCEICKKCAEHYYWDLLDDEGKSFFKVIMDDLHEMASLFPNPTCSYCCFFIIFRLSQSR
jgi:hypothetical protein